MGSRRGLGLRPGSDIPLLHDLGQDNAYESETLQRPLCVFGGLFYDQEVFLGAFLVFSCRVAAPPVPSDLMNSAQSPSVSEQVSLKFHLLLSQCEAPG